MELVFSRNAARFSRRIGLARIVCAGASNTQEIFLTDPWPIGVASASGQYATSWTTANPSVNGQTIADFQTATLSGSPGFVIQTVQTSWTTALTTFTRSGQTHADAAILVAETNDAKYANVCTPSITVTPTLVVSDMQLLWAQARSLGVACFVTTVNPGPETVADSSLLSFMTAQNAAIRAAFPADQVIDFTTAFSDGALYLDGQHLNQTGANLRATTAAAALARD